MDYTDIWISRINAES